VAGSYAINTTHLGNRLHFGHLWLESSSNHKVEVPTMPKITHVTAAEVREWARQRGYEVGERGRLATELVEAFNRRHPKRHYVTR